MAKYQYSFDLLLQHAIDCAKQIDAVKEGDRVVIVAGIPMDTPGSTNTLGGNGGQRTALNRNKRKKKVRIQRKTRQQIKQ